MTDTVRTIHRQLLASGIGRRGVCFLAWDPDTLKVYGCDTRLLAEGVYADNLLDVVRPTFLRAGFTPE